MKKLKKTIIINLLLAFLMPGLVQAVATSRIKDIADFEGVRDNMLVGYGLVTGLNGTGDKLNSAVFTRESFIGMLERLGVNAREKSLNSKNIAAVMVTATLKPFSSPGMRVSVDVSTIGDATDLRGGTLIATPLQGADGQVYVVAQGQVVVSGFSAIGQAASITKGHPTSGNIPNGGLIENKINYTLNNQNHVNLFLRNPDFTTANNVVKAINSTMGTQLAKLIDQTTISMNVPLQYKNRTASLLTRIEQIPIAPDMPAKITIHKASGVIVMGADVRIAPVAIAHGNLTIKIIETPEVSQPEAFSDGVTAIVPRTTLMVEEGNKKMGILRRSPTIGDLVRNLNALGVTVPELMDIITAVQRTGAVQALLEII